MCIFYVRVRTISKTMIILERVENKVEFFETKEFCRKS